MRIQDRKKAGDPALKCLFSLQLYAKLTARRLWATPPIHVVRVVGLANGSGERWKQEVPWWETVTRKELRFQRRLPRRYAKGSHGSIALATQDASTASRNHVSSHFLLASDCSIGQSSRVGAEMGLTLPCEASNRADHLCARSLFRGSVTCLDMTFDFHTYCGLPLCCHSDSTSLPPITDSF